MQWSIRLGAHKPEVLQQIEKRIWKAILNIVNQPGDYLAILKELAFAFPSAYIQELQTQSETASDWFSIDLQQSQANTVQNSQECNTKDQASSAQQSGTAHSPVFSIPKPLEDPIIRVAQARTSSSSALPFESRTNEVTNSNEDAGGVLDWQKDQAKDLKDNQGIEKSKVNGDGEDKVGDDEENDDDRVEDAGGKGQIDGGGKDKAGDDEEMHDDRVEDAGRKDGKGQVDGGREDKVGDDEEMDDDRVEDAGRKGGKGQVDGGGEDKVGDDEEMVEEDAGGGGEDKVGDDEEADNDEVEDASGKGQVDAGAEDKVGDDEEMVEEDAGGGREDKVGDDEEADDDEVEDASGKGQVDGGGENKAAEDDNDGVEDALRRSNRTRNSQQIQPSSFSPNKVRRKKPPLTSANQAPSPPKVGMFQPSLFASEKSIGGEALRVLKVCITPCYSFSIYSVHDFRKSHKQPHFRTAMQRRFIWVYP